MDLKAHSCLLVESLLESRLLVDELGGFYSFNRSILEVDSVVPTFNFAQKLGHLYEDALEWVFSRSENIDLLKKSLQVYRPLPAGGRETLGEFDFLVRAGGEFHHVELATKFYLQVKKEEESVWPGPDARDSWDRKRERLISHQLEIGQKDEAKSILWKELNTNTYITSHLIYGCLFWKLGEEPHSVEGIADDAHCGVWIQREQWDEVFGGESVWAMPKHLWPCVPGKGLLRAIEEVDKQKAFKLSEERCAMFTDGKRRVFLVSPRWLKEVDFR